jgi:hypothetical protein
MEEAPENGKESHSVHATGMNGIWYCCKNCRNAVRTVKYHWLKE